MLGATFFTISRLPRDLQNCTEVCFTLLDWLTEWTMFNLFTYFFWIFFNKFVLRDLLNLMKIFTAEISPWLENKFETFFKNFFCCSWFWKKPILAAAEIFFLHILTNFCKKYFYDKFKSKERRDKVVSSQNESLLSVTKKLHLYILGPFGNLGLCLKKA